ncbi:hypothetical protein EZ449_13830 [Pedobacter frigidisoli]|uniref:Uncharacterized protein n=1 Tax=Pedobacter frigidisoli TaxID=2530455 RepID=A0A4R0P395_9SPHI|nr:hypothetical protein [Pedobacter frigidisoli]TCD07614.1 hypothetical protein EZ449_13830 [Pedobacter frigidisoli]
MIKKVVNSKGGLHNRLTRKIRLLPFTLHETEQYLISNNIHIDRYQALTIYMAMGGVPHYLKELRKGESATQAIDRLFFTKDGLLSTEFANLYRSLFENADRHISVVKALADKPSGLTRNEIIGACNLQSGGLPVFYLRNLWDLASFPRICPSRRMPIKAFTNLAMNTAFSTLSLLNIPAPRVQVHG